MHQELVEKLRWISEHRYLHALDYCMLLPCPEATQLAIYISWLMHGVKGGIIAGALLFLPGFLLLALLAGLKLAWGEVPLVQRFSMASGRRWSPWCCSPPGESAAER
jgi:chromate transporter